MPPLGEGIPGQGLHEHLFHFLPSHLQPRDILFLFLLLPNIIQRREEEEEGRWGEEGQAGRKPTPSPPPPHYIVAYAVERERQKMRNERHKRQAGRKMKCNGSMEDKACTCMTYKYIYGKRREGTGMVGMVCGTQGTR